MNPVNDEPGEALGILCHIFRLFCYYLFLRTLGQVWMVYREAKFSVDEKGTLLSHSRPPVLRRILQIK